MTIEINRPEIEALIQQRLHSGAFVSVEEVLFDALEMQREREAWFQENKEAVNAKIERGLAQLERGEGIPGDELRRRLAADKAAWLKDRSGSRSATSSRRKPKTISGRSGATCSEKRA